MNLIKDILFITILFAISTVASSQITLDSIADGSGYTYIACPAGAGPFPAVLYNHGGLGTAVGGDLRGTVVALAQAGYFARAEKRMETVPIAGHLAEVENALASLRADSRADTSCVSIMGFSRGGLLTFQAGKTQANKVHSIIIMAAASANGLMETEISDVSPIEDPILVLVANNDTAPTNLTLLAQLTYDSLIAGGKTATLNIYPDYDSNGDLIIDDSDDGHNLFFVVQEPYWTDVMNFLNVNSCNTNGLNNAYNDMIKPEIYPNPFKDQTTIEFHNLKHENHTMAVYDTQGRLVRTIANISTNQAIIERNNPTSGLYFFQLQTGGQLRASGKLRIE